MKRLLIIEDNIAEGGNISRIMGNLLECQVQVARTLAEAWELIREWQPEVIVADIGLPDSPPEATISAIIELSRSCPVIILTGQTGIEADLLRKRAIRNGARSFVQKDHAATCWNCLAATIRDAYLSAFVSRTKTQPIFMPV